MSSSPSTSCGVSTAVGSSRISTSAPRYSALRISTRCCSPTDRVQTAAAGSIGQPILVGERDQPFVDGPAVFQQGGAGRRLAQHDVLGHGERLDQHEVLVDHAEARRRSRRPRSGMRPVCRAGGSRLRPADVQAVQHVHQGGLARAVLAQKRVDLTGQEVEIHAGVGEHAREALDDAAHLDDGVRRCSQGAESSAVGIRRPFSAGLGHGARQGG